MNNEPLTAAHELLQSTGCVETKLILIDLLDLIDDLVSSDSRMSHDADRAYMDLFQELKSTRVELANMRRAMGLGNAIAGVN